MLADRLLADNVGVRAELTIRHNTGDFLAPLSRRLPADDRSCLSRSVLFASSRAWQANVAFATETPHWRLVVYSDGADQWQMVVEPIHGDLKKACGSLWSTVQRSAGSLSPKLERLEVIDDGTGQVVTQATTGLVPQVQRRELWLPLAVGLANGVIVAATGAHAATIGATAPGFVAAGIALLFIISDGLRKSLVWHD